NRQRRRGRIDFQNGDATPNIGHKLSRRQLLPIELNAKVVALSAHRIGGVNRSCWIDEKAGAGKLTVFIVAMNLHDRLFATIENIFDLAADAGGRWIFGPRREGDGKNENKKPTHHKPLRRNRRQAIIKIAMTTHNS